jgi:nucleoside-diphosphate kinase
MTDLSVFIYLWGQISEIVSRFERKGFKLVGIKLVVPSKEFAEKHYHDLKERPFFSGLCDFLSSGPVLAMVKSKPPSM